MRFALDLKKAGTFFFDTLPDLTNALQVANSFKPFESDVSYEVMAIEGEDFVDLVVKGIKFSDHISFGLTDDARRAFDKFERMAHRLV
jgi:hypothetical protein